MARIKVTLPDDSQQTITVKEVVIDGVSLVELKRIVDDLEKLVKKEKSASEKAEEKLTKLWESVR